MTRLCAVLVAVAAAGCSSFIDDQAAKSTYRILQKSMQAANRQSDIELARTALPGGLIQLEAFALAYPKHRGFRVLAAESLCQYAAAFLFDDWEDADLGKRTDEAARIAARLVPLLGRCIDGQLALLPAVWRTARAQGPDAVLPLLPTATRDHVAALRWLATADALWLALDPARQLARFASIKATLLRCTQLAPGDHDGEAELLLGTIEAAASMMPGGGDGSAQFARARQLAGDGVLMIDVMYARGVGVARRDRALLESTLRRVIATDLGRWPERRLANEIAVRKARRYLAASAVLVP